MGSALYQFVAVLCGNLEHEMFPEEKIGLK